MPVLDHAYEKAVAEDSIEAAVRTYMQGCEYEVVEAYLATNPDKVDAFQQRVGEAKTRFYIDVMIQDLEEEQDREIQDPREIGKIYEAAAALYAPVIQQSLDEEFSIQEEAEKAASRYAPVAEMVQTMKDVPIDSFSEEYIKGIYTETAEEVERLVEDVREETINSLGHGSSAPTRLDRSGILRGLKPALQTENIKDVMRQVHGSQEQYIETARERFGSTVQYLPATADAIGDDIDIGAVTDRLEQLEDEIGDARKELMEDLIQWRARDIFDAE